MWIFWALFSALTAATRRTQEKKLANVLHPSTNALMIQLLSLPVITAFAIVDRAWLPFGQLGKTFWLPLLVTSIGFYPLYALLYWRAMKHGELSRVLPIQSLWPVLTLVPAWLFLHERPTFTACIGIGLTVLGVYALGLKGRSLHHPLQPFREDKASLYMLLAVVLVAATSVLDTIAIQASNAAFYSFMSTACAAIMLGVSRHMQGIKDLGKVRQALRNFMVTGTLQGASYTTYLLGMAAGPVAYVTAIRSSNILVGAALGIVMLNERPTRPKLLSFAFILLGGIVLTVG